MADPISWGLIDDLSGEVDRANASLNGTSSNIDFLIDRVQDVKTDTNTNTETIASMNTKMDKLVEDVHNEIQADPTGVPAPHMAVFNTSTSKDGIKVDYTVNVGIAQNGQIPNTNGNYNYPLVSVTKGVMVRYSDTHYPTNREDGDLAFIDEDVLTTQSNGQLAAKAKSQIVTANMQMNMYYYFTAFPYSNYNVYNEQMGTNNCKKEQYLGDVGIVKISVSADILVRPLNYTITLSGNGKTFTKQGVGNSEITFAGVPSGTYNLSTNTIEGYNTPSNQSVIVVGGQTKNVSVQYKNTITFETSTWSDIDAIGKSGKAQSVFKIGDAKNIVVNGETITLEIVDFYHDDLTNGGKAPITFGMKHLMINQRQMDKDNSNVGGFENTELYGWLTGSLYNSLPSDLKAVIKPVNKKTSVGNQSGTIRTTSMNIWLFSQKEVTGNTNNSYGGEGYQYPIFANTDRKIKKLRNGSGDASVWHLRSPARINNQAFAVVMLNGNDYAYNSIINAGVCFGICV